MKVLRFGLILGTAIGGAYALYRSLKEEAVVEEGTTAMNTFPPAEEPKTFVKQPRKRNQKVGPVAQPQA